MGILSLSPQAKNNQIILHQKPFKGFHMIVIFISTVFSIALGLANELTYRCDQDLRVSDFSNDLFKQSAPWTSPDGSGNLDIQDEESYVLAAKTPRIILSYPFNTPLQLHLGATGDQRLPTVSNLQAAIRNAVETGTDPYLALAVGLHESGPNNLHTFTSNLHDSALMRGLECRSRRPRAGSVELVKLPRPNLLRSKLEAERRGSTKAGRSWFCVGRGAPLNKDIGEYTLLSAPSNDYACCAEVPFEPVRELYDLSPWNTSNSECSKRGSYGHIPCAHTANFVFYQFIGKLATSPTVDLSIKLSEEKREDISFRVQSVLGFSRSTGLAMPRSIANWRLGHDSTKVPVYGLTVVDFYLHSLLSNPWISREVQRVESQLGIFPQSLLCFNKTPGETISLPSDYATKLISQARRFELQRGKWMAGTPLSAQEQDALEVEIARVDRLLSRPSLPTFQQRLERYFTKDYAQRSTVKAVSVQNDPGLSWQTFTAEEIRRLRTRSSELIKN